MIKIKSITMPLIIFLCALSAGCSPSIKFNANSVQLKKIAIISVIPDHIYITPFGSRLDESLGQAESRDLYSLDENGAKKLHNATIFELKKQLQTEGIQVSYLKDISRHLNKEELKTVIDQHTETDAVIYINTYASYQQYPKIAFYKDLRSIPYTPTVTVQARLYDPTSMNLLYRELYGSGTVSRRLSDGKLLPIELEKPYDSFLDIKEDYITAVLTLENLLKKAAQSIVEDITIK